MKRVVLFTIIFLIAGVLLAGCNSTNENELFSEKGYVLDKGDSEILVAQDISADRFSKVQDEYDPEEEAYKQFEADDVGLIYITYDDISDIEEGDKVEAQVAGVDDSYPAQAKAKKMSVQN